MSKPLCRTAATGDSMRVTTKLIHRHDGRAQMRVTTYVYDGIRYHRAQQRTVSYDYSATDAHAAAIIEASDGNIRPRGIRGGRTSTADRIVWMLNV